jgi:hypothetical protein
MRMWNRSRASIGREFRSRAVSAIAAMPGADDRIREAATAFVERHDAAAGPLAHQVLMSSSPEYMRAFAKLASENTGITLDDTDRRTLAAMQEY